MVSKFGSNEDTIILSNIDDFILSYLLYPLLYLRFLSQTPLRQGPLYVCEDPGEVT